MENKTNVDIHTLIDHNELYGIAEMTSLAISLTSMTIIGIIILYKCQNAAKNKIKQRDEKHTTKGQKQVLDIIKSKQKRLAKNEDTELVIDPNTFTNLNNQDMGTLNKMLQYQP